MGAGGTPELNTAEPVRAEQWSGGDRMRRVAMEVAGLSIAAQRQTSKYRLLLTSALFPAFQSTRVKRLKQSVNVGFLRRFCHFWK